jgi:hypothetical protein
VDDSKFSRARSARSRPHWWVVLAVSLSLLALVAARSAAPQGTHDPGHAGSPGVAAAGGIGAASPPTTGDPTAAAGSTVGGDPVTPPTSATVASPAPAFTSTVGSGGAATAHTTPTTTTTTVAPSGTAAAPMQPSAQSETYTGDLQYPDDSSATYSFTGSGSMEVSASWSGPYILSLSVSCPSGTQSSQGPSPVTVVMTDGTGACVTTLKETQVQYNAVGYTLNIGPTPGG